MPTCLLKSSRDEKVKSHGCCSHIVQRGSFISSHPSVLFIGQAVSTNTKINTLTISMCRSTF